MASEIAKTPTYQKSVIGGDGMAKVFGTPDVLPDLLSERFPAVNAIGPLRDAANLYSGAGTTYTDANGMPQKGGLTDTYSYESAKNMNTILVAQTRSAERALKAAQAMMQRDPAKGAKMLEAATAKSTHLQKAITKVVGKGGLAAATKGAPILQALFVGKGFIAPSKSVMANIKRWQDHDPTDFGSALMRGGTALFDPETQGAAIRQATIDSAGLVGDIASARSTDELGDITAGVGEGSGLFDYGRKANGSRSLGWSPKEIAGAEADKFIQDSNKIPDYKGDSYYDGFKDPDYYSKFTPEAKAKLAKYKAMGYLATPPQSYTAEGTRGYSPESYYKVSGGAKGYGRDIISPGDMPAAYKAYCTYA